MTINEARDLQIVFYKDKIYNTIVVFDGLHYSDVQYRLKVSSKEECEKDMISKSVVDLVSWYKKKNKLTLIQGGRYGE